MFNFRALTFNLTLRERIPRARPPSLSLGAPYVNASVFDFSRVRGVPQPPLLAFITHSQYYLCTRVRACVFALEMRLRREREREREKNLARLLYTLDICSEALFAHAKISACEIAPTYTKAFCARAEGLILQRGREKEEKSVTFIKSCLFFQALPWSNYREPVHAKRVVPRSALLRRLLCFLLCLVYVGVGIYRIALGLRRKM